MEQHADETQDRVRQRAYELWEQHGRSEGHEAEFWRQAECELRGKRAVATPAEASARMPLRRGVVLEQMVRPRIDFCRSGRLGLIISSSLVAIHGTKF